MNQRHCFALDLVDNEALIAEYRARHEPGSVWPAVIDHIRARGIIDMEIWQRGDRLFMVVDATDDYPRNDPSEHRRKENARWEACMASFQRVLPNLAPGEKWAPMSLLFRLAAHARESRS